jgi:phage terminase large subunit-like protein
MISPTGRSVLWWIGAARAEHLPAQVASFERLYLNRWFDGSAEPWIDLALWDDAALEIDLEDGAACWVGVDLSSTSDLTAVVALIERGADEFTVIPRFFAPEDNIRRRSERDGAPYALWSEQGHIVATPGAVVDYGAVEDYIASLAERFRVEAVAIDRWNSTATTTRLLEAGLPVIRFGQSVPRPS